MFGAVVTPSQSQCRQFWLWCSIATRYAVVLRWAIVISHKVINVLMPNKGAWEGVLGGDLGALGVKF